jgi:hypothetical protein
VGGVLCAGRVGQRWRRGSGCPFSWGDGWIDILLHMYTSKGTGWNARKNAAPLLVFAAHGLCDPLRQSRLGENVLDEGHVSGGCWRRR